MDYHTFEFSEEDAYRIVQALRNEAFNLTTESQRACEKGARDYGTILWEETKIFNTIAESISRELKGNW